MDGHAAQHKVDYSDVELDRSGFISWQELKEIDDSGLVEIASHSYDMHHGIVANPQGNKQPAATALALIMRPNVTRVSHPINNVFATISNNPATSLQNISVRNRAYWLGHMAPTISYRSKSPKILVL